MKPEAHNPPARPDLVIMLNENLPDGFEGDLQKQLATTEITTAVLRLPSGPFAGIELYLPSAVMLFIASAYFGSMAKKAGEDHYEVVKCAAKSLYKKALNLRVASVGTPGKVSATPIYSLTFSIMGEVAPRLNFKFILETSISKDNAEQGVAAFLDLIRDIHTGSINEEDLNALLLHRPVGGMVLVTFDATKNQIVPVIV